MKHNSIIWRRVWKHNYLFLLILFLIVPKANALTEVFERYFMQFEYFLNNPIVAAGITLIAFFVILLGAITAALRFVPLFKTQNGITKQGKSVAAGISLIGTLGIFFYNNRAFYEVVIIMNRSFGVFGAYTIGAVFGLIAYHNLKGSNMNTLLKAGLILMAIGVGMIIGGSISPEVPGL